MARRRRRRRRNPSALQWGLMGLGAVAAGAGSYALYRLLKERKAKKALADLPPPPGLEAVGVPEEEAYPCGREYPGFVFDGEACVPTQATPAGIYVAEGCSDFVFVEGDEGPQLDYLEAVVDDAAASSAPPEARSADPTKLATDFFSEFWGECPWPPPPTSSQRIVQLYQAIVYVIGREIIAERGRVLGTSDPEIVDEQIAERLGELGFFDFNPEIVPEIELPSPYGLSVADAPTIVPQFVPVSP